ncbi:MAG TPA: deoxyhypusine synthase [Candidatus Nitrosocosmicus sp.]|nr:deoxyhypusine synthase [Candidatus Nitrosocosmicus sp.]
MNHDRHSFSGKKIDPPEISANMSISEMIDLFRNTGYNARRLAEAADILKKMVESNATICLTISGALTPIGFGKMIATMIENGFVDWIVTTGANAYHDLHFAYDLPVRQGHFDVDDDVLYSKQIVRIYDVYIKEYGTLQSQDLIIQKNIQKIYQKDIDILNGSTADLSYLIGKEACEKSKSPEKSFMVSAFKANVPIYMPALSDSSIGLNMLPSMLDGKRSINPIKDIAESTAILWKSKISGGFELGGGVPKNFFQQTGPALYQILKIKEGGHDFIVQLTDARPDTGGLSGATLQEGKSWGKIKTSHKGNVIVYGDSSVYFPILCSYLLSECKPRERKQIFKEKDLWVEEMKRQYISSSSKS